MDGPKHFVVNEQSIPSISLKRPPLSFIFFQSELRTDATRVGAVSDAGEHDAALHQELQGVDRHALPQVARRAQQRPQEGAGGRGRSWL